MKQVVLRMPEACAFVESVLTEIDHEQLSKYFLAAHGYVWQDLLPYMKLVYTVCNPRQSPFHLNCLEIAILGLQLALAKDAERRVLQQQGLLDYCVCLPWHLPARSKAQQRARSVVDMVGSHIQLQPPSLSIIVKSKLAAIHFGLEKILNSDCHVLIEEILT